MNKIVKFLMVGALAAQVLGSWAMENKELVVENQTGTSIAFKWTVVGSEGISEEVKHSFAPKAQMNLGLIDNVVNIKFGLGIFSPFHLWNKNTIKEKLKKSESDILVIRAQDLTVTTDLEIQSEKPIERGVSVSEAEIQVVADFLNWFPRMKSKLIDEFGEQEVAENNLDNLGELIELGKKRPLVSARDILNLGPNYTEGEVNNTADGLISLLNKISPRAKKSVTLAKKLVEWARQEALKQLTK